MKKLFSIWAIIVIFALIGEVKCIVHLCQCDFEPSYKAEVIYGVATISGAGSVIGWIDFGK